MWRVYFSKFHTDNDWSIGQFYPQRPLFELGRVQPVKLAQWTSDNLGPRIYRPKVLIQNSKLGFGQAVRDNLVYRDWWSVSQTLWGPTDIFLAWLTGSGPQIPDYPLWNFLKIIARFYFCSFAFSSTEKPLKKLTIENRPIQKSLSYKLPQLPSFQPHSMAHCDPIWPQKYLF